MGGYFSEQSRDSERKYSLLPSDSSHTPSVLPVPVNPILPNLGFWEGTAPALLFLQEYQMKMMAQNF